jgi:hypothetical protein
MPRPAPSAEWLSSGTRGRRRIRRILQLDRPLAEAVWLLRTDRVPTSRPAPAGDAAEQDFTAGEGS